MLFDGQTQPATEQSGQDTVDPYLRPLLSAATVPIENPEIGFTTDQDGGWDA